MPDDSNPRRSAWTGRLRVGIATLVVVAAATTGGIALGAGGFISQQTPTPTQTNAEELIGIAPVRVLDTRPVTNGPIGVPAAAPIGPNSSIDVQVTGFTQNGVQVIPEGVTSVAANITIDEDATLKSFVTVWPTGEARPLTSANNAEPGLVAANSAILKLGAGGKVSVYNFQGNVNVVIDITGYFMACGAPLSEAPTTTTTTAATTTTTAATTTTTTTAPAGVTQAAVTCAPPAPPVTTTTTTAATTTTTTTAAPPPPP
jgi:hypothetical protein